LEVLIMSIVSDISRALQTPITNELLRTTPNPVAASDDYTQMKLLNAFGKQQTDRGLPAYQISVQDNIPDEKLIKAFKSGTPVSTSRFASAKPFAAEDRGAVRINPNVDAAFFAHELGHHSAAQKGIGKAVNDLRDVIVRSPNLKKALTYAIQLGPMATSALIPGGGDLAAALAIGLLPNIATLTNEAQASLHGLDLMKRAGMPATMGQRGRLAGAFMSYATPGLLYGLGGNVAGNIIEKGTMLSPEE